MTCEATCVEGSHVTADDTSSQRLCDYLHLQISQLVFSFSFWGVDKVAKLLLRCFFLSPSAVLG